MKTNKLDVTRIGIGFLAMALIFLGACNPQPKKEAEPEMASEPIEDVDAPKEIISLDKAKELCENYENRRIPIIKEFEAANNGSNGNFTPVQFIAFDLETIKNYVKYVEQEASRAKVKPDSLRIYLGNYGEEGRDPNRNTVFILPTAKVGENYGGFYIEDNGQAKLIRDYWPKANDEGGQEGEPRSKASFMPSFNTTLMQGGGSLVLNFGQGGPPPHTDF